MADSTPMFVVGLYHYYLWTGDQSLLDRLWPSAKRAITWVLVDSTKGTDFFMKGESRVNFLELSLVMNSGLFA